ncbi:NAD(P)/FAD-dependent oxidoreductase [Georgenia sp. SYP-B2076]|uniref:flavin-containing monooxygenase n=1 Tax=Georgenia sp. SYP-B2076 TaxID=2495881 RepID=UPI000F8E208A|nr:FAD-dependent oxidoreductase [Georgenia sp. SYP-B2076]
MDTVIIGAGQTGLAAGYHLARRGQSFVILEARDRVGGVWRERYDSLRLFTPAHADGLPGMRFPAPRGAFPTGAEMGAFLETYAARMALPVRTGVRVDRVRTQGGGYVVTAGGHRFDVEQVVVATGGHRRPYVPAFAADLDPRIVSLHSTAYHRPDQLPAGPVVVVGAGTSGADLALELAGAHSTYLVGPDHGEMPLDIESPVASLVTPVLTFLARHVLTLRTPVGRRMAPMVRHGGAPLIRVKRADLDRAGVERIDAHVVGVRDGLPVLDDGRVLTVRTVVWCTGFREDFGWVEPAVLGEDGYPRQWRGDADGSPGLYFLGLPFLYAFSSGMVHGAGRDAAVVARHITARQRDLRRAAARHAAAGVLEPVHR